MPGTADGVIDDHHAIRQVLSDYFSGLYTGDIDLLRSVFHPQAASFAEVDGQAYHQPVEAWFDKVAQRTAPAVLGEPCAMRVLSIDVLNAIAMAKVHVPARGFDYYNYLSLLHQGGRWRIVNKVFDELPPKPKPGQR
nr:nuclear transport factor 2 family protein [Massilia soli]